MYPVKATSVDIGATPSRLERLLKWREEHVSQRMFVLTLAFVVGIFAAVAAYVLHSLINLISALLTGQVDYTGANWLYLVLPVVGIFLTGLFVRYVVKDNISHGITRILSAISTKQSRLKGHNCWSSVVASAITIGFGGSVGAEAPIVLTGSAIGSNLGKLLRLDSKTLMLLIGCGAAGAIAGIFKAPIAGLVFTLEVLMIDLTMASLLPILVSCVMVGCRGETPECFEETYAFLDSLDVTQLHVFPYSERPGTSALSIPYTVSDQDKKLRSKRLLDLSDQKTEAFYRRHIGQEAEVLLEKATRGKAMHGFTKNYIRVELPAKLATPDLDNQLVKVRLGELTADKQALRVYSL